MPPGNHQPHPCKSCGAPVLWAATLDEHGERQWGENAKTGRRYVKSMPVDAEPNERGNVVLYDRPGEGIVARVLRRGEQAPAGAKLRTSHFATCPQAAQHRRSR